MSLCGHRALKRTKPQLGLRLCGAHYFAFNLKSLRGTEMTKEEGVTFNLKSLRGNERQRRGVDVTHHSVGTVLENGPNPRWGCVCAVLTPLLSIFKSL